MHTYDKPGRYNITYRVNSIANSLLWKNRTEYICVYSFAPEVDFEVDPFEGYTPLMVSFTDLSPIEGIISWNWDMEMLSGNRRIHDHTYQKEGEYSVALNVSTRE